MYMWKLFAYKKIFAHGKIKRKEVHGEKEKEKEKPCLERKERVQFCQENKKIPL